MLAITMATLGQIALCVPQLLARAIYTPTYLPLAFFFIANGVISTGPAIFLFAPEWDTIYIAMIFPAWLLLGPVFWLYVEGLTSETSWHLKRRHLVHFIPAGFGLVVTGLLISLPLTLRRALFNDESDVNIDTGIPLIVIVGMLVSMVLWALQSGYYVVRIAIRLSRYRKQLKNLFASNEQRELGWLSWLLFVILACWILSLANLLSTLVLENSWFGYRFGSILSLLLVWTMAHWGLRQKPGFEGRYSKGAGGAGLNTETGSNTGVSMAIDTVTGTDVSEVESSHSENNKKYERSALSKTQAERIANKINRVMAKEQLHLDSSLSLHKLARHIAISPNYISQTLNDTMGTNFFDYVNKWRVETAKPEIIANEDTVLNIALEAGFNARSSFYKAFKKETGKTPGEFRKFHQAQTG